MIPKEKAGELYEKFKPFTLKVTYKMNNGSILENNWNAKKCALILVDEIIKDKKAFNQISVEYWEDVKQEIENI